MRGNSIDETADGDKSSLLPVSAGPSLSTAAPKQLFRAAGYSRTMLFDRGTSFDMTRDGQHFILRLRETANRAVLVQNWFQELETRLRSAT